MSTKSRRITTEDLYKMKWGGDPQLSPKGDLIAYVLKEVDPEDNMKYKSHIWVVPTKGGEPRQYTNGPTSESNPRWSADGKMLAFTSTRNSYNQIWVIPTTGGEATQLTSNKFNVGAPEWSPDGKKIAFTASVSPNWECEDNDKVKSDVKVITRLRYKMDGIGFLGDKRSHLFVIDVNTKEQLQLTTGDYDHRGCSWSPCSKYLAFSANRTKEADYENVSDIWVASAIGGDLMQVTNGMGPASNPVWSPDGQSIAYIGHENAYQGATLSKVYVIPKEGGTAVNILADFDRSAMNLMWEETKTIYFAAINGPRVGIYQANVDSTSATALIEGDYVIGGLSYNKGQFALHITTPTDMGDIYYYDGGEPKKLTHLNKALEEELALSLPELFSFQSDGMMVEGWVLKPIGFKEGETYPAIIQIHGGPHSTYMHSFNHEFQLMAAQGYVVVYTNPPGSQGYGQEFVIQTHHDWGGKDYNAIMAAVEHVSAYDYVDEARFGITGGSYGGYLTNWAIGHTNFFKAAVTQRSTALRYSQFGTSDIGYFNGTFEFKGNPWDNPEFYLERSPITYVKNIETPLLIIHSENDLRCPIEQGEQLYSALKWLRKEVMFVRFPNESHGLSRTGKPRHRVERLEHIIGWFKKYIETNEKQYSF